MNYMQGLNDGPGWSPDGGAFDKVGDRIYWGTGEVTDLNDGGVFRVGIHDCSGGERFSEWTEEKRAAVLAENQAKWDANAKEEAERNIENAALIASAKTKLTEDEYNAVYCEGRDAS